MTTYALTPEQVKAVLEGFDLATYKGWTEAAQAMLQGAPSWTAIKDAEYGYVVTVDGHVCSLAQQNGGDEAIYNEDQLVDFDHSAWDETIGSWMGGEQASAEILTSPIFVTLRHE